MRFEISIDLTMNDYLVFHSIQNIVDFHFLLFLYKLEKNLEVSIVKLYEFLSSYFDEVKRYLSV